MSSSSSPVLVLELRPSWLRLLPAGVLLIAGITLPWLAFAIAPTLRVLLVLSAACLAWWAARQVGLGHPVNRLIRVTWRQDLEWQLQFAMGEPVRAQLSRCSWLSSWLMCWRFSDVSGRSQQVLLWRPEFSKSHWQQWQLRLRLEGVPVSAAMAPEALH